jgi:uncharacterized membrane protein
MAATRRWYNPSGIWRSLVLRPRLYAAALTGLAVYLAAYSLATTVRVTMAWDVGALVYLVFAIRLMALCGVDLIKSMAGKDDDGRAAILLLVMLSIGASLVAIAQLAVQAKSASDSEKAMLAALGLSTIMISWMVMQVTFALHYAHEYYMPEEDGGAVGGLDFAGGEDPDYWDFLYFSTSIGATSQTSDTAINSRILRRLVTIHAVLAFFFNTAILALTINVAGSLAA